MPKLLRGELLWALLVLGHESHSIFSQHHQISGGSLVQRGPVFLITYLGTRGSDFPSLPFPLPLPSLLISGDLFSTLAGVL